MRGSWSVMYPQVDSLTQDFSVHANEQIPTSETVIVERGSWYAVYTRSRHEKLVHQAVRERGIESLLPLRNVLSQWKDRRKWVQKPLFPGYLFVRVKRMQLSVVTMVRGVAYIVGNEAEPICVPDEQVEAVRRLVEGPYPVEFWPLLQKGKRVRVTIGPLAGLETYIVARRGRAKCRLVVTVELLGRSVSVEIDPSCVEPIV